MEATAGVRVRLRDGASPIANPQAGVVRKVSDEQPVDEPSQDADLEREPARNGEYPVRAASSPATSSPATSSRATSSRATSSRATTSSRTAARAALATQPPASSAVPPEPQDDAGTFAAAEEGRGVASDPFEDNAAPDSRESGTLADDNTIDDGSASLALNPARGTLDDVEATADANFSPPRNRRRVEVRSARGSAPSRLADQPADDQPADDRLSDDQLADGRLSDDQPDSGQLADGVPIDGQPTADQATADQPTADQPVDGQLADDQADDGGLADGMNAVEDASSTQPGLVADAADAGEELAASEMPAREVAESEAEVLEQGVPFVDGNAATLDNADASDAVASAGAAPAPVMVANQASAKRLRTVPANRPAAVATPTVSSTTSPTVRQVVAASASAGAARRVLPMGPPSTIPHRSLPALPPRKVEAAPMGGVAPATSVAGAGSGTVTAIPTAGTIAVTTAQPGVAAGGIPGGMPSDAGETPLRNAAFCRRLYNERNCCSDENACNDHRAHVKSHPLSKISLDITPTCNLTSRQEGNQANCGFPFEQSPTRIWRNRKGQEVTRGRVTGFAHLQVEVTDDKGNALKIRLRDLSEDDICFLAAWCGVPSECRLDDVALAARNWTPITMTWKASALCHKPLYFEEVQLERYGHTMGPIAQPVVSGAHFFANIALLPYNMGIHPMSECQYALGYYRPGSCAPWMIPPFPLSARGALAETGVILGGIYLIP